MVRTETSRIDTYGARWRVARRASAYGNAPMRPIAKAVRLATLTPALALAIVELTMARKTKNQKMPYRSRATPSHELAPSVPKPENLSGPNATSIAYVVKT